MNMDEQQVFIEALENLKEYSKLNFGVITKKDILDNFGGVELEDSQLQLIYGYLQNNNIKISDVIIKENAFEKINSKALEDNDDAIEVDAISKSVQKEIDDENDKKFVDMYMEDLQEVKEISELEEAELLSKAFSGDKNAENQFIEGYLPKVVSMIEEFRGKGVHTGDLIQEGNLLLMTLVKGNSDIQPEKLKSKFSSILKNQIAQASNRLIEEQKGLSIAGQKILNRVNAVNDCAIRLSQELGRKVTVDEVAGNMGISVDSVKEAIDFSSNKIEDIKIIESNEK